MVTQDILIREIKEEDLPEVKIIFSESVKYHEQLDNIFKKIPIADEMWSNYIYTSQMQDEKCKVFVAEFDGKILGYCFSRIIEKPPIYQEKLIGEIENIGVKEGYKRQGIGECLFNRAKEWIKSEGVSHIEIEVATTNPQSMGFWKKMGGREFITRIEIKV